MLEQSEGEDDRIVSNAMKELRLVSRYWSPRATSAIGVLRLPKHVLVKTLVETVAKSFINVRSLKLDKVERIDDENLVTLCKLSILTALDIIGSLFSNKKNYIHRSDFLGKPDRFKGTSFDKYFVNHKYGATALGTLDFPDKNFDVYFS